MSTEGSFAKAFPVPSLQNDKAASGSSRLQSDSMNRKILLVDDEVAIRNVYQLYLENHGHLVISASSVSEAFPVMQVDEIHLIIIDIFLDNDSGLDLLKGVIAARPRLPAILMGHVQRHALGLDDAAGIDGPVPHAAVPLRSNAAVDLGV